MIAENHHIYYFDQPFKMKLYSVTRERPHYHKDTLELMMCLKGNIEVISSTERGFLEAGDILSFDCKDIHTIQSKEDNLVASFYFNLYDSLYENPSLPYLYFFCCKYNAACKRENMNHVKYLLLTLLSLSIETEEYITIQSKSSFEKKLIKGILDAMLKDFVYLFFDEDMNNFPPEFVQRFQHILVYITQHYTEKITIKKLSEIEHLHPTYLSQCFKHIDSVGFKNYLYLMRIYLSERLLLGRENLTIPEIAYKCGFSDPKFYYREFKKSYGKTPYQHVLFYKEYLKKTQPNVFYEPKDITLELQKLILHHYVQLGINNPDII